MSDELPQGWAKPSLSEIAEINPRHPKRLDDSMPVSFAPMAAVSESKAEFQFLEERPLGKVRQGFTHFAEGDVLFAKITPCMENGKGAVATGLRNGLGCGTTELIVIRPLAGIDPHYVYRFLAQPSVRREAKEHFTGTAGQQRVPTTFIEQLELPIAPIIEQRRIVAKLEMLLGRVDACQNRLANIPNLLRRFRQSVVAAACSGRLTADWRGQTGTAVDSSGLDETPDGFLPLPETWRWVSLETICTKIVDCPHSTPKWTASGRLCVRTTNFKPGFLDLSEVRYVSSDTFKQRIERLHPQPGDILYSREGGILGIACIIPPGVELCLGQRMMLLRTGPDFVGALLMHWLNSRLILSRVQQLTGGTASPHLNVRDIKDFPIPMPPLAEQQEIVSRMETLLALADQIEARLGKAQAQVDKLTPSLFAKAFSGELVPTEAELARQEHRDYEPVSVLLERLQHEREDGRSATKEEHEVSKTKRRVTSQRTRVMNARPRGLDSKRILTKKPPQTAR